MTQNAVAAQPLTIPATGLEHRNGDTVLRVFPHPQAGYLIQGRRNGAIATDLCSQHNTDWDALQAWKRLVAEHTAPGPTPAAPAVKLAAVAKGAQTKVTDPQHTALAVAAFCGRVERGGHEGQASVKTLTALAKRGHLDLTYQQGRRDARRVVTGGTITGPGRTRLAQLTAADRELAEYAARLAANLAFDAQPTTAPVAA
jgi:hypothetical protein